MNMDMNLNLQTRSSLNVLIITEKDSSNRWIQSYIDSVDALNKSGGATYHAQSTIIDPYAVGEEALIAAIITAGYIIIDTPGNDQEMNSRLFTLLNNADQKKPVTFISGGAGSVVKSLNEFQSKGGNQKLNIRIRSKGWDDSTKVVDQNGAEIEVLSREHMPTKFTQQKIVSLNQIE